MSDEAPSIPSPTPLPPLDTEQPDAPASSAFPLTALPNEVLAHVFGFLLPTVLPTSSTYPNPQLDTLDNAFSLPESTVADLYSASLVCRAFRLLALEALWRAPVLTSLRAIRRLAEAVSDDALRCSATEPHGDGSGSQNAVSRKARMVRALHLPAGDGLLQAKDTLGDQNTYASNLRILFDHVEHLQCLSIGHRPGGRALFEFLHPRTRARPRRVTIANLSFSSPPFSTLHLAPLAQLTHLHLIKIVPSPALISFLCASQVEVDADPNAARDAPSRGDSPSRTLSHLRLSLLPPDALLAFPAFIEWRRRSEAYERLPGTVRLRTPAPRAPQGPARRFAAQEALYTLATHSHLLPHLCVLLLELEALHPLASPDSFQADAEPFRTVPPPIRARVLNAEGQVSADGHGRLETTNFAAQMPVALDEVAVEPEALRTGQRDSYWAQIEAGKRALFDLWHGVEPASRADGDGLGPVLPTAAERGAEVSTDIRIVAPRPGGHDRYEGMVDFLCQSGCFSSLEEAGAAGGGGQQEGEETGSWADPDVFDLARQRPGLSFRPREGRQGEGEGDWRGLGMWWTGELPRVTQTQAQAQAQVQMDR